jgi:hypothetical protein
VQALKYSRRRHRPGQLIDILLGRIFGHRLGILRVADFVKTTREHSDTLICLEENSFASVMRLTHNRSKARLFYV